MSRARDEAVERAFSSEATDHALAALSDAQRGRLRQYWIDRASGELTTALTFEFMLDDLTREDAPIELLQLAQQAIADEHRHVDWCLRWARRVDDASPAQATLGGTRPLTFEGGSDRDNRLLRTVFGCCFSETVAIHVLLASHGCITLESVKLLNHQHLKEEVGHSRLGWALLGSPLVRDRDRDMLREYVPEMKRLTREVWLTTERAADVRLEQAGFLSSPLVCGAYEDALRSVVIPGLEQLGVLR